MVSYRWSGTSTKTTSQILWIRVTTLENLKVVFLNADQFTNKKDDIAGNEPDIILISEVLKFRMYQFHWLYLFQQACFNFDPISNIATNNMHGVAIYVHSRISGSTTLTFIRDFKEHLWVKIPLLNHDSLLIGCLYRSPSSNLVDSTSSLCNLLNTTHVMICGNLNFPNIDRSLVVGDNTQRHLWRLFRIKVLVPELS